MNPKISKIDAEISKLKDRISSMQERIKELEQQRTALENTDIVGLVRGAGLAPHELEALLQTFHEKQEEKKNEE